VDLDPPQQIELVLITLIEERAARIEIRLDKAKTGILAVQLNETLAEIGTDK
jgi:hypothetical protein